MCPYDEDKFRTQIINNSHRFVLEKLQAGETLDWFDRAVLLGMRKKLLPVSQENERLFQKLVQQEEA